MTNGRRRRTAEQARREILEAAERRLVVGGPEAIRLQDIAADVGVSHPAILHHFGSREGLVEALAAHGLERLQSEILAGWPSKRVPDVEGVLDRMYRLAEQRGYARLLAWLILSRKKFHALPSGILRPLAERVHAARIRAARREGRPPPEDFDTSLFAAELVPLTVFGDALFGSFVRRSIGLPADAATARQFRKRLTAAFEILGTRTGPLDMSGTCHAVPSPSRTRTARRRPE